MKRLMLIACLLLGLLLCMAAPVWAQEELTVTTIHSPTATDLTLKPTSDLILSPTGSEVLPSTGYSVNLGRLTRKYLALHAAELWVETLVAQNTIATIGGRVLVGPTSLLTEDFTAAGVIMVLKHNSFVAGDHVYMESDGRVEFMAITAGPSAHVGGGWEYSVTRSLDPSGANDWAAGSAVFNTGQAGNGFIDLYSVSGVRPGVTEIGPTIVGNVRTGSTYNAWEPRWAIGNLDGLYGYTGSTYGSAFGVPGGARVTMDATNGIRMFGGDNDEKVTISPSGVATFDGRITVGTSRNMIRNSECRVSTADWSLNHNTGLTTSLSFNLPSYRLMDVSNTCYIQVTGTPAVGTLGQAVGEFQPAGAGLVYEASAYLGNHRTATSAIILQFYNAAGTVQTGSATGSLCTEAMGAGGTTLAGYCRSTAIATAPVGTSLVRVIVQAVYDGVQANPFIFFVRGYLAEGKVGQTQVSEWGPAGITEIIGGLITTDAIDARTIAANAITTSELDANSVTSAKIVAGTIVASDIASGTITATEIAGNTITADRLNVSTLSAISGNMGTLTAGSITGGTIDGATINAGSGDEVVLNSSGITISNGTGTNNRIKWGSNIFMYGAGSGLLWLDANEIFLSVGGGGTPNVSVGGGVFQATNGARFYNQVDLVAFQGSGNNRFVCHDNNGVLYSSGTTCDGSSPEPATIADLKDQIEALRAELAALRAERRQ